MSSFVGSNLLWADKSTVPGEILESWDWDVGSSRLIEMSTSSMSVGALTDTSGSNVLLMNA